MAGVTIPIWLLIALVAFAALTILERVLAPSVRWFLRRRMQAVVSRLNTRLSRPIEPFRLAQRHDTIQRLIYDPKVMEAVAEHARDTGTPKNVAFVEARAYAREIVPSFSASAYFGLGTRLARFLSETLYRVRLAHFDEAALAEIPEDCTVIFVMNHRSNMDYVLVTYLASGRTALSYAVGEWARVWPLSGLIRSMGAYFIRRKSRNALYRRVLARYVQIASEEGVTQAIFPEGGLSLSGATSSPKLGLLSYVIAQAREEGARKIVFVPVAINYDHVLEDRILIAAGQAQAGTGERRFHLSVPRTIGAIAGRVFAWLFGRLQRYGYAAVSFGAPMALDSLIEPEGEDVSLRVADRLMARIRALVPVLPVPLVARVLAEADGEIAESDLIRRAVALIGELKARGASVHVARDNPELTIELGLRALTMRKILEKKAGKCLVLPDQRPLVDFYAASIAHL